MTKKLFVLAFVPFLLISCKGKDSLVEGDIKFACPTGAPALAFFNQGNNPYFITNSESGVIGAELQKNECDVVVYPAMDGLKTIKENQEINGINYRLAKIITGGNFYLISVNKTPGEGGEIPLPSESDYVVSFQENKLPDKVFKKLCSDHWYINPSMHYVDNATMIGGVLKTGKHAGNNVDYIVAPEPAVTRMMLNTGAETYGKLAIVKSIRSEWKALTGLDGIVQAGLFVNKNTLETKQTKIKEFMNQVADNMETAINNPDVAAASINVYSTDTSKQNEKFGFFASDVINVQADGHNGFGLLKKSESLDVNAFLTSMGMATYPEEYFVNI